jgi:ABC-2 type transport system permease protein
VSEWTVVARREFLERVRTVWFVVVTVLGPVAMLALLVVPAWLGMRSSNEQVVIQVVDRSGRELFPTLDDEAKKSAPNFDLTPVAPDIDEAILLGRIRDEKINGYLVIPPGVLAGEAATYRGDNATNLRVRIALIAMLTPAIWKARAADADIPLDTIARIQSPQVDVVARHDTGRGETTSAEASFVAGFAVMFILYMSIVLYAVNVMRSVIQEKTSRVVEIVVSAIKPRALMLGKVVGVGSVGLLQLAIWSAIALVMVSFRREVLGLFGIEGSSVEMPPLDVADVAVILTYFALGYFFYAALYAAVGAMVNSDQEAQQVQTPVLLLLLMPVVCVQLVGNDPRGGAAQVLTLLPFSSPVLMPMRYLLGGATWTQLAASLAILLASTWLAVAAAGRIYRIGILMYGKRPSLRELARWLRYS